MPHKSSGGKQHSTAKSTHTDRQVAEVVDNMKDSICEGGEAGALATGAGVKHTPSTRGNRPNARTPTSEFPPCPCGQPGCTLRPDGEVLWVQIAPLVERGALIELEDGRVVTPELAEAIRRRS